jgi:hypothetical protein
MVKKTIRSISFDTSFLLSDKITVDKVIKKIQKEEINCFVTFTVVSELEQLKVFGRISDIVYKKALNRWNNVKATVIDFKNQVLKNEFGYICILSMKKHHGVDAVDIANDCNILVSTLKNGIDLFLSEDYHFTSAITTKVISDIRNKACIEFHQMCNSEIYNIDSITFLDAFDRGKIDLEIIKYHIQFIKKPGKKLKL